MDTKTNKQNTETDETITETTHHREAMEDVKAGHVTHYKSLDDFYKEVGIKGKKGDLRFRR